MRSNPGLGLVNFALVSAYFVPAWGHDALRVLTSPYNGFEDRAHAVAAIYFRDLFDLGLAGLIRTSEMLAALKMVITAAFLAYLIEFARALAMRRQPNRETVDVVLVLALVAASLWILPTLMLGDPALIRLQADRARDASAQRWRFGGRARASEPARGSREPARCSGVGLGLAPIRRSPLKAGPIRHRFTPRW
jgi:hypothetical protein